MLKADLHLHAGEDKYHKLRYSSKELIDHAAKLGFEVISLTFHNQVFYSEELAAYAKEKGVLLIPGIELFIEGREVLIYNLTNKDASNIKSFDDLRVLKRKKNLLVIAPHPFFYRRNCLGKKLVDNIDLFDAIEYSYYYLDFFNPNKKAGRIARINSLPLIGGSDAHNLCQLGKTFSLIDSKKDLESVFEAVRKKKTVLKTRPCSLKHFIWRAFRIILNRE